MRNAVPGLGLSIARDISHALPQRLLINIDQATAEAAKQTLLTRCGDASVEVKPHSKVNPLTLSSVPMRAEAPVGVPVCPTCRSTNVRRITGGRKVARVAAIGLFAAPKAMKSYECLTCKARW
jgi:hypothetical protein